jgi:hypothetical protein
MKAHKVKSPAIFQVNKKVNKKVSINDQWDPERVKMFSFWKKNTIILLDELWHNRTY